MAKRRRSVPQVLADPRAAQAAVRSGHANRVLWFLAALTGIPVAVAVLGAVLVAGASSSRDGRVERGVSALLAGIPQEGQTLGARTAPVTLQVFAELKDCSSEAEFLRGLPAIISEFVRTNRLRIENRAFKRLLHRSRCRSLAIWRAPVSGRLWCGYYQTLSANGYIVKIQYRSFMTASSPYPNVFVRQQAAVLAAGIQDRLWNFIEAFYHEQRQEHTQYVIDACLAGVGRQIPGLDLSEWESNDESSQLAKRVIEGDHAAQAIRFPDAPLFLIGRTGGKLVPWPGYRLYEEPGLKPGFIKRPVHPVSFITSRTLGRAIEHLSSTVDPGGS